MLPVGSDHVIPARWVTDVAPRVGGRYVWPRFVPAIPREFFAAVRAASEAEPPRYWIMPQTRDMNPVYTGKDVSYADTKLAARAGETAVLEGERLATLAWLRGAAYPAESLDKAWRQLAYGAHHDAITGTESDEVYLDLLAGWREAWQRGDAARAGRGRVPDRARGGTAGAGVPTVRLAVTVVNGLARERDGMATATVRLDARRAPRGWRSSTRRSGAPVPALAEGVRRHPDGSLAEVTLTFRARGVPPLGFLPLPARPRPTRSTARPPAHWRAWPARRRTLEGLAIENDAFAVTGAAGHGALASVVDKAAGRGAADQAGQRPGAAGGVRAASPLERGPVAPVAQGPGLAASRGRGARCGRSARPSGRGSSPRTRSAT